MREAFAEITSPGRLEIIRRSPMILLDAAHNPHGAEAAAAALEDSFAFSPLIGVVGVMADKDAEGVLAALEPHLAHVVCTQNSTARALPAPSSPRSRARSSARTGSASRRGSPTPSTRRTALAEAGECVSARRSAPAPCW